MTQTFTMLLLICWFWMIAGLITLGLDVLSTFFVPIGKMKCMVRESTLAFGFSFNYSDYYTLDVVICPYLVRLVSSFGGMKICHPTMATTEAEVDELLATGVESQSMCKTLSIAALFNFMIIQVALVLAVPSDAVFCRCVEVKEQRSNKLSVFNEKMLHLVDGIFWLMGFDSSEHAEKAKSLIAYYDC